MINYRHSQPSVVAHPRELMVGCSMGCGVGMVWELILMCIYELNDLMFLIKSLKLPTACFNIGQYISLILSAAILDQETIKNLYIPEQHLFCTIIFTLTILPDTLELFTSDKPNTASPHYQAENKIISLGTFH